VRRWSPSSVEKCAVRWGLRQDWIQSNVRSNIKDEVQDRALPRLHAICRHHEYRLGKSGCEMTGVVASRGPHKHGVRRFLARSRLQMRHAGTRTQPKPQQRRAMPDGPYVWRPRWPGLKPQPEPGGLVTRGSVPGRCRPNCGDRTQDRSCGPSGNSTNALAKLQAPQGRRYGRP